eukprot:UN31359
MKALELKVHLPVAKIIALKQDTEHLYLKEDDRDQEKKIKPHKAFMHMYGDHISLLNIFNYYEHCKNSQFESNREKNRGRNNYDRGKRRFEHSLSRKDGDFLKKYSINVRQLDQANKIKDQLLRKLKDVDDKGLYEQRLDPDHKHYELLILEALFFGRRHNVALRR